jgi:hypothetical protein
VVDDENGPDEAALAVVARHALHDEELVAALATGSLDDEAELARARSFIERCTACRALHDDIAAIGAALKSDARGTQAAPRDFRLTVEDARRLGGTVTVGGFATRFRRAVASFGRPVGASMAALGVVGLLVGSVSLGAGTAAGPSAAGSGAAAATSAPAEIQTGFNSTDNPKTTDRTAAIVPGSSGFGYESPTDTATAGVNPVVWLLGISIVLLVGGIGLLVAAIRRNP